MNIMGRIGDVVIANRINTAGIAASTCSYRRRASGIGYYGKRKAVGIIRQVEATVICCSPAIKADKLCSARRWRDDDTRRQKRPGEHRLFIIVHCHCKTALVSIP